MKIALCITSIILLTSTGLDALPQNRQNTPYRVVIVGAGLAGYSAAAKLIENEIDNILVLEAEDRIGGRVHSIPYFNGMIDMGAQWLHGQGNNLIYEMIDGNFDFGDSSFEDAINYFSQTNGIPVNQTQVSLLADMAETLMTDVYIQDPMYIGTFGSFFTSNYFTNLRTPPYHIIPWNLALQVQNFFHTYINNYFGSKSWFDISIAIYGTHDYTTGSQWVTWRDEGFDTVFDFISRRRPDPTEDLEVDSKIELNKEVTNISWEDDIVTLRCSDGEEYSAEYVIFTGSLGVLKDRHDSLFTPTLPERKVSAIENSDYGSLEKLFLEFESPFWNDTYFAQFSILWTQDKIIEVVGTDKEWLLDVAYFRRVDAFPNLLGTFFIGARIPDFDAFTESKIIDDCMWLFEQIGERPPAPPIRALRSDWITKKNFLGSYSLFTMNSAHHEATPSVLAEPVSNSNGRPRIFFAGEATSATFSGYSNGAVETGFRAAEEVLQYGSSSEKVSKNFILLVIMFLPSFFRFTIV